MVMKSLYRRESHVNEGTTKPLGKIKTDLEILLFKNWKKSVVFKRLNTLTEEYAGNIKKV